MHASSGEQRRPRRICSPHAAACGCCGCVQRASAGAPARAAGAADAPAAGPSARVRCRRQLLCCSPRHVAIAAARLPGARSGACATASAQQKQRRVDGAASTPDEVACFRMQSSSAVKAGGTSAAPCGTSRCCDARCCGDAARGRDACCRHRPHLHHRVRQTAPRPSLRLQPPPSQLLFPQLPLRRAASATLGVLAPWRCLTTNDAGCQTTASERKTGPGVTAVVAATLCMLWSNDRWCSATVAFR